MKTKTILFVFLTSIVSLIGLQAIVMYNAYNSQKEMIKDKINFLIRNAVEKEAMFRYNESKTMKEYKSDYDTTKVYKLDIQDMHKAGGYQHPAHFGGYPFDIHALDSILKNELQKVNIFDNFSLIYRDSTGATLAQTDGLAPKKMEKAFKTDEIYIIYGNRVQALVDISPPTVYRQMVVFILLSFIILVILFFCVSYQTNTVFSLKKLDMLKNDFFHAIVHNLKNPLGTFKTVLSKFISGDLEDHPKMKDEFGKIAMAQLQSLLILIERILTTANIEKENLILNRSVTDMNGMMRELKEIFSVSNDKQVTIHTSVTIDDDQTIYLDRALIKDAISNLIDNAIKYSDNSVMINILCNTIEDTLQIRVVDNGYGISEKLQSKIFEKFERGDAVARNETKGFGLGLHFVKYVTEAHGGIVSLYSHEGEGSEFTLSLPLQPVPVMKTKK